jgi:hypothetical protein
MAYARLHGNQAERVEVEAEPVRTPPEFVRPAQPAMASTVSGFVEIAPPIPAFVDSFQMQRFAWGMMRQNKRFTFADWRGFFSRDGQFVPLRDWMMKEKMARKIYPDHPKSGVELIGRGEDWLENIIQALGPPPR